MFGFPPLNRSSGLLLSLFRSSTPLPEAAPATNAQPSIFPTAFPSSTAVQRSDQARRKLLAKTETRDLYHDDGTPMLNKEKTDALLAKMGGILQTLKSESVNSLFNQLNVSLAKVEGDVIPLETWAELSLQLEKLLELLKPYDNTNLTEQPHLSFIKFNIQRLEFTSRYMWMQLAHEKLIEIYAKDLTKRGLDNPAFNTLRAKKVSAEASTPLLFLSVNAEVGVQNSQYFDDEGYLITNEVLTGSFGASAKIPLLKGAGQISGTCGNYKYSRFARAHAICNFCELLVENKKSPKCARFLSRNATLGLPCEPGDTEEMSDFYAVQKDYLQAEKSMAQSFSLVLSLNYLQPAIKLGMTSVKRAELDQFAATRKKEIADEIAEVQKDMTDCQKIIDNRERLEQERQMEQQQYLRNEKYLDDKAEIESTIKVDDREGNAGKKAVLLNGELTTKTGTIKGTLGLDESFFQFNVSKSGEWSKKETCATRYATFSDLLQNKFTTQQFRADLNDNLEKNGFALRRKLYSFWHPEPLTLTVHEEGYYSGSVRLHDLYVKKCFGNENVDYEIYALRPGSLAQDFEHLKRDFEFYSDLHAHNTQKSSESNGSIDAFHKKYGANSTEECLQKMAVLTAYFFLQLLNDKTPEATRLRSRLSEFEMNIHATGIPHRPEKLRELASARQNYYIKTDDKTLQFSFKSGLIYTTAFWDVPELGCKINWRKLLHFNPLRSGDYTNIDFTLGTNVGANLKFLQQLRGYLEKEGLSDLAGYLANTFKSENFATGTMKGVYSLRSFKPTGSGNLPKVRLYERVIGQTGFEFSPKAHLHIPGITDITLGYTSSGSDSHLLEDKPKPDSILLFAIHYLHALFTTKTIPATRIEYPPGIEAGPLNLSEQVLTDIYCGKIKFWNHKAIAASNPGTELPNAAIKVTKEFTTGKDVTKQESYWHVLLQKHKATLEQLFLNMATGKTAEPVAEPDENGEEVVAPAEQIPTDKPEVHRVIGELQFIKERFLKFASEEETRIIDDKMNLLIESAKKFKSSSSEENYNKVLLDFKLMLQNIFEHWMMTRERSEAYGPWQYDFGNNVAAT